MAAAMVSRGLPWEPLRDPTVFHVGFYGRPWAPTGARGIPRHAAGCHEVPLVYRGSFRRGVYRLYSRGNNHVLSIGSIDPRADYCYVRVLLALLTRSLTQRA